MHSHLVNINESAERKNNFRRTISKNTKAIDGYTMREHISNMASLNEQYEGNFILEVTILKGYNDTEEAISLDS